MTKVVMYQNQHLVDKKREDWRAPRPDLLDEQQRLAQATIQRVLVQFHRDWTALRSRKNGERWRSAANALLDQYSHQLYDIVHEVQAFLEEDLFWQIRTLSADMIKTTNILYMIGYDAEYRERGDVLAQEAIRYAEKCVIKRQALREQYVDTR